MRLFSQSSVTTPFVYAVPNIVADDVGPVTKQCVTVADDPAGRTFVNQKEISFRFAKNCHSLALPSVTSRQFFVKLEHR